MDRPSECFQVSLREGLIPGPLTLPAARPTFSIQSHLIRRFRNSLHPCINPWRCTYKGFNGSQQTPPPGRQGKQPPPRVLCGQERCPPLTCSQQDPHHIVLAKQSSLMQSTALLRLESKQERRAGRHQCHQNSGPGPAWPHAANGTKTRRDREIKHTTQSPLSLSFPSFLSGFQDHNHGLGIQGTW